MKTWRSALMSLRLRMSPSFQGPSQSNRTACDVEGPKRAGVSGSQARAKPATAVTCRDEGEHLCKTAHCAVPACPPCPLGQSHHHSGELCLVAKCCLLSCIEKKFQRVPASVSTFQICCEGGSKAPFYNKTPYFSGHIIPSLLLIMITKEGEEHFYILTLLFSFFYCVS